MGLYSLCFRAIIAGMMSGTDALRLAKIGRPGSTLVARKFHFTRERIERLPLPTNEQRAYYYDLKVRGLAVAVSPAGKKTFIVYRKVAGRPERITIGPYTDLSIEQARKRAEQLNSAIAQGNNPAADRRSVRDEFTLKELFDVYLERYAKPHKRTWKQDESLFRCNLHGWQLRKIGTIKKADVVALHARIGRLRAKKTTTGKRTTANRTVELLGSMFNRAIRDYGWKGTNPAAGVTSFHEEERARFLGAAELRPFFQALADEPNEIIRDFFLLALFTGARRANLQAMTWPAVNWELASWTIPADQAKGRKTLEVALSPEALRILESRKAAAVDQWVFPGTGKTGHLVEPKTAWTRICRRAGIRDLRLHDLRRTLGSWQAGTGASLVIIGKSLGHSSVETTQIYARLLLEPVRAAVEKATNAMLVAGGGVELLKGGQ
jgi:integrase